MVAFASCDFFSEKKGEGDDVTQNMKVKNFSPTLEQHFTKFFFISRKFETSHGDQATM
jgi:hypothetical protein